MVADRRLFTRRSWVLFSPSGMFYGALSQEVDMSATGKDGCHR